MKTLLLNQYVPRATMMIGENMGVSFSHDVISIGLGNPSFINEPSSSTLCFAPAFI